MKSEDVWKNVHAQRAAMADTWASLSADQWSAASWCDGWSVQDTAGHVLASAEQTPPNFFRELAGAGFKFNVFADRGAKRLAALGPDELIRRLRARTTTTNHPPGPTVTWLGEIVAHGEDIRRPLGLTHEVPEDALVAVADFYKGSNLLIGSKARIAGLRLRATDAEWTHGDGPEVAGSLSSLILAMTGRKEVHADLTGDGVATLASRS